MTWTLIAIVTLLAYANGANDNFKGVATLFGSRTLRYRGALVWATVTTLAGSLIAVVFAARLVTTFSGKGLVPDAIVAQPEFLAAVGGAAAGTVLLAALVGLPISTTHALTGALAGTGWIAAGPAFGGSRLLGAFFVPLLISPALAVIGSGVLYPALRWSRRRTGVTRETCVCFGEAAALPVAGHELALSAGGGARVTVAEQHQCARAYSGRLLGFSAQALLDRLHFLSAGAVSFARGLNDAPKIVALLLTAGALSPVPGVLLVALAMAVGGWLGTRRVAWTMSRDITRLNHGQGFTANLVTAALVVGASRIGVPVSTTHVSCGSLFGIGLVTGGADGSTIARILMAWLTTLPVAAICGAVIYMFLSS